MSQDRLTDIKALIQDISGVYPDNPDTDIFKDIGLVGDDFHEMIEKYSEKYQVDISDYLWYFHTDEEGHNIGGLFYSPPYKKVKRIPVTPKMLTDFSETKKWKIEYPDHEIPTSRPDLKLNMIIFIGFFVLITIAALLKYIL
jgi:hypothetical protein